MKVKDLLRPLFKYLWLIIALTIISFLFFFQSISKIKQSYLGEATLLVMESKDKIGYNILHSQKDVIFTIIYNRKFLQRVARLKNLSASDLKGAFNVLSDGKSNLLRLSYTGANKEIVLHTLQKIIESIDPINEELGFTSQKPLFVVLDEPSVNPVDIEKYKFNYLVINTLAVFFTLIAIVLLLAYIKHEKSNYVKK